MHRAASFAPGTYNAENRSVQVVWTEGARVVRMDWWTGTRYEEELVVSKDAIRMDRLNSGRMAVLDTHQSYGLDSQIGAVTRGWLEGAQGLAELRLSDAPSDADKVRKIETGIIQNISVGYRVHRYEVISPANRTDGGTVPLYRAVDWEPTELSFVPVPADAAAATRSTDGLAASPSAAAEHDCQFIWAAAQSTPETRMSGETTQPNGGTSNAPATPTTLVTSAPADNARAADILDLCQRHGMTDKASQWIRDGNTLDQVRAAILDAKASADESLGSTQRNLSPTRVQTTRDETDTRMRGVELAITSRIDSTVQLDDNARQYRGMSLMELGRDFLEANGVNTRGMDRLRLAGAILQHRSGGMHTTSDFSSLMANVANKRLRNAYEENPPSYKLWTRRAPNAVDFKPVSVTTLSNAPDLEVVNEHGEFKFGQLKDGAESYAVVTAGKIVALTRQSIINDDLRAFDRLVTSFGNASARYENRTVYGLLTANAALSDGVSLFSGVTGARTQANITTGGGSALALAGLTAARTMMRVQKGLQSEELNIAPKYLLVPAALEIAADQITNPNYVAATTGAINPFRQGGRTALEPIVEALLDSNSATQWYLAADPSQIDTIEYMYLDGAEGPMIESEVGFETDGISYKCRLDFNAKAIDYRGFHRAAGA